MPTLAALASALPSLRAVRVGVDPLDTEALACAVRQELARCQRALVETPIPAPELVLARVTAAEQYAAAALVVACVRPQELGVNALCLVGDVRDLWLILHAPDRHAFAQWLLSAEDATDAERAHVIHELASQVEEEIEEERNEGMD